MDCSRIWERRITQLSIRLMPLCGSSGLFSNILEMEVQTDGSDMGRLQNQYCNAYKNGTAFNIHMRENGLIYADAPGKALTWMDAVVNGIPVTPRRGYAVEINALWYNAVCFSLEMARIEKDKKFIKEYENLPGLIKESFLEIFWDEKLGYLADYVNDDEGKNIFVRPNMVIAVSLPYSMLDKGADEKCSGYCR